MLPEPAAGRLFHVSDRPDITLFEPRPPASPHPQNVIRPVVWGIAERLLHNYLLPRHCPRVTFYARPDSDPADVARLMGQTAARHVVAVESGWLNAIRQTTLYLYELPSRGFVASDPGAGYYVSETTVMPLFVCRVDDLLGQLARRDVELRLTPSLWPLRDAVLASTLQFSFIRMRNARPEDPGKNDAR
ncbi:MAG: hypothetical protein R3C43_14255 [Chloroflexota bacterium]